MLLTHGCFLAGSGASLADCRHPVEDEDSSRSRDSPALRTCQEFIVGCVCFSFDEADWEMCDEGNEEIATTCGGPWSL